MRTECLKVVHPTLTNVQQGSGCRYCANHGMNFSAPAVIYLITHPERGAHKHGITGVGTDRLAIYNRQGWQTFHTVRMTTGAQTHVVEQAVQHRLRAEYAAMPFLTRADMLQNGHTETISADLILLLNYQRLVHEEIARLNNAPGNDHLQKPTQRQQGWQRSRQKQTT